MSGTWCVISKMEMYFEGGDGTVVQRRKRRTSLRGREEELTALWNGGLSDGQIAGRVGCTAGAVQHWRRRNDLPRNWERGRPRGEWTEGL